LFYLFLKKLCFSCEIVSLSGCGLMKKSIFKKTKINKDAIRCNQPAGQHGVQMAPVSHAGLVKVAFKF